MSANLDGFVEAFSSRGAGYADDRLLTFAPRRAAVGDTNGVGFDQGDQLVFHESWFGEGCPVDEQLGQVVRNATNFSSSLHATACWVHAFATRLEDARRTLCAGYADRLFFTFRPQLEGRFALSAIDSPSHQAAPGNASADEELSEDHGM